MCWIWRMKRVKCDRACVKGTSIILVRRQVIYSNTHHITPRRHDIDRWLIKVVVTRSDLVYYDRFLTVSNPTLYLMSRYVYSSSSASRRLIFSLMDWPLDYVCLPLSHSNQVFALSIIMLRWFNGHLDPLYLLILLRCFSGLVHKSILSMLRSEGSPQIPWSALKSVSDKFDRKPLSKCNRRHFSLVRHLKSCTHLTLCSLGSLMSPRPVARFSSSSDAVSLGLSQVKLIFSTFSRPTSPMATANLIKSSILFKWMDVFLYVIASVSSRICRATERIPIL